MSYILDALRKADKERTAGEVPDLATSHWTHRREGRARAWVWAVGALLLINGLLVGLLYLNHDDEPGRSLVASDATGPVDNKAPRRPVVNPPLERQASVARQPRAVRQELPAPPQAVSRPPPAPPAAAPRQRDVVPAPAPAPAPAQRARNGAGEFPEWNEMPLDFRRDFAPPKLDVHVYDDDASRRFILVRLKRFSEGDTLDSGAILEEILPGSILLNYRGTRFRIDR